MKLFFGVMSVFVWFLFFGYILFGWDLGEKAALSVGFIALAKIFAHEAGWG